MKSLNHIYRTIWSDALGAWIAVSEITRCKGKRSASSLIRAITVASGHQAHEGNARHLQLKPLFIAIACCFAFNAHANPVGGQVVNGNASFNTSGNTLTVTNTPGTIINWQNFSIGANETTRFAQQSASSTVLNRVVTNNPSAILGTLSSNGQVYLVNANGIMFGAGSTIDVAGLVATTLNLSNADFLAGRHNYTAVTGAGDVSNAGNMNAQQSGYIYLIAPNVENTGIITAPNGEILLAAGHEVQLVNSNEPSLRVSITAPAGNATNLGKLIAQSGSLGLFGAIVKNSGTVSADSAVSQGGKIVFKSRQSTVVGGSVSATGTSGGSIEVLGGNNVQVAAGATLDASGSNAGGTVLVGGDRQGLNPNVVNAQTTYVDAAATIKADATQNGNGGKVIVWSDHATRAYGNITARGGANGGNGGFIETSGHLLDVNGINADASAPHGNAGEWLLDPWNVTISPTGVAWTNSGSPPGTWNPVTTSIISSGSIATMLTGGTSVVINTTGAGADLGDITVNGAIAASTPVNGATLTLNAAHNIFINQPITNASANVLNLVLNHNSAGIYTPGATSATLANTLTLTGGNLTVYDGATAGAPPPYGTLNITGGATNFATGTLGVNVLNISGGTNSFAGFIGLGTGGSTLNTISVSGGTTNFSSAPVITGAISIPNVSVTGGTLNLNTPTGTTITNLSLSGTGTLGGTSAVTLGTGTFFNWYGGTVALTGTGSLTLAAGSTTTLGNGTLSLTGTMTNSGTMSQQNVNGGLTTALNVVGGNLTNNSILNIGNAIAGAFTLNASNGGIFTNAAGGTVNSAGAVSNLVAGTFGVSGGTITNSGAVNVGTGNTLEWQNGVTTTSAGTFGTVAGSTLNITQNGGIVGTGTYTGAVTNAGTYSLSGGVLSGALTNNGAATLAPSTNMNYAGAYSGTGSLTLAPSGGVFHFAPTGVTTLPSLTYNGLGSLYIDIPTIITNLTLNGSTLRGTGAITIPTGGSVTSSGTSLNGTAAFTISSGATANFTNTWIQRPVTNSGTLNITGTTNINSNTSACCADANSGSLTNAATGVINLNNGSVNPQYGSTFTNSGQVIAVSGANNIDATSTFGPSVGTFINNGSVTVNAGASLSIVNGGASTNTGTFTTAAAAGVLPGGVLDFNMAAAFVPGGTVYIYNGALTNNGTMTFSGGTYSLGSAITNNAASPGLFGILTPAVVTDALGITNGLGSTFALSGTFNGAVNNAGTFALSGTLTGNLTNSGVTTGTGSTITGNVTNSGAMTVVTDTLNGTLNNSGSFLVAGTSTVNGLITNTSTGNIDILGGTAPTLNATAGLNNAGIINLSDPGTSTDTSTLNVTGAALNNTNTINSIGTMGGRVLSATTLNNTGGTINIMYAMSVNGVSYAAGTTIVGTTVNLPPAPMITPPVISELVNVTNFPPRGEDKKKRLIATVASLSGGDKTQAGQPTLVCQ